MSNDEHAAGDTWTVAVTIPMSLPDELKDSLFRAICDAAYAWEPADRDGWDIDVVGAPIEQALARAEQAEAAEDRLRKAEQAYNRLAEHVAGVEATRDRWRRRAEEAEARLAALMDEQTAEQIERIQAERDALPEEKRLRLEAADAPFLRIQVAGLTRKVAEAERASELAARQIWDKLAQAAKEGAAIVRADDLIHAIDPDQPKETP